eukprot:TRINITY_DN33584_c0_g1_i1.p1 TRINITY_DN33584_c0_g1~~TRINITY_DN33584_c0_g1_i1.p1  ORF type:complete len:420 (+),score=26.99 TRINITY_DN33584_c0_g1_i1:81-1340(+)
MAEGAKLPPGEVRQCDTSFLFSFFTKRQTPRKHGEQGQRALSASDHEMQAFVQHDAFYGKPRDFEAVEHPEPETKEVWEFEEDSYAVALVAMTTLPCPRSLPHIMIGLFTPILQNIAFLELFIYLSREKASAGDGHKANWLVLGLCFILCGLSLSNEAIEGFQKLVHCLRGLHGMYHCNCGVVGFASGAIFGYLQYMLAILTASMCMILVYRANTVLDAFTNYVALSFLTEVDNLVMASRSVKSFVQDVQYSVTMEKAQWIYHRPRKPPWSISMMVAVNVIVLCCIPLPLFVNGYAASVKGQHIDWVAQIPGSILTLAILNGSMYFAAQRLGATNAGFLCGIICQLIVFALCVSQLCFNVTLVSQLSCACTFLFSTVAAPSAAAGDFNPFESLRCPVRVPLLVWLSLICSTIWTAVLLT